MAWVASTWAMGLAGSAIERAGVVRALCSPTSSMVPQAWHSAQRPTHLTVLHPHSVQRYPEELRLDLVLMPSTSWLTR